MTKVERPTSLKLRCGRGVYYGKALRKRFRHLQK